MNKTYITIFFFVFVVLSSNAQNIISYEVQDVAGNDNQFDFMVVFDANSASNVNLSNVTFFVEVDGGFSGASSDISQVNTNYFDGPPVCSAELMGNDLIEITVNLDGVDLGVVTANDPIFVASISLSGSGQNFIVNPFNPNGVDPLSTCLNGFVRNTGTVRTGTASESFEGVPGGSAILLPINLKSFSADKHSETSSILNWESLSEINASHYIIERSVDTKDWTAIGKVATTGSETEGATYSYVDSELPIQSRNLEQIFYYRLRMVDLDGSYEFSHTEAVRFDMILLEGLHILPNPTAQDIYVSIDNVKEGTELLLLDNTGKVVLKHSLTDGRDERVSLNSLSAGTYFAKVIRDNELLTKKLIKID